jgi:CHAT domain-containing protein
MRDRGALPNADDEVKAIGDLMHGKTWLNADATREHFMTAAPQCGILHLAMHGLLNEGNPMLSSLVFDHATPGNASELFALELYNIQLQARMTVLSACNTGKGKVHNGEGVMSLARAFAFAGCPTTVSSLWSVNDLSTATIMKQFYHALRAEKPVDEAMRDAKLAYINAARSENAKPIYWASFVVVGNSEALPGYLFPPDYTLLIWIIAGGLLAMAGVWSWFKWRKWAAAKNKGVAP